jgi:hypothetical protein
MQAQTDSEHTARIRAAIAELRASLIAARDVGLFASLRRVAHEGDGLYVPDTKVYLADADLDVYVSRQLMGDEP